MEIYDYITCAGASDRQNRGRTTGVTIRKYRPGYGIQTLIHYVILRAQRFKFSSELLADDNDNDS